MRCAIPLVRVNSISAFRGVSTITPSELKNIFSVCMMLAIGLGSLPLVLLDPLKPAAALRFVDWILALTRPSSFRRFLQATNLSRPRSAATLG